MRNALRRKRISMKEYNLKMARIIKMGKPVSDTLILLLEEAGKYDIKCVPKKGAVVPKKQLKVCKRGR